MLIDEITVFLKAGDGGKGKVSFGKMQKSGPDGGNGGDGGNLFAVGSSDLTLLNQFHPDEVVSAEDGRPGDKNKMSGKKGSSLTIRLPIGTTIVDLETGESFDILDVNENLLLCKGGKGGIGNFELRSATNTTPKKAIAPTPGQARNVKLTLRYIADFGLIGLPSAGKSSLLNELTNAKAKTAAYHFTTLSPNLGVLPDGKKIIADIPGLIEGAHTGRGLGIKFLKHIEKVGLLLHCISSDSLNPVADYQTVRNELGKYSESLLKKNEIILLTKTDLVESTKLEEKIKELANLGKMVLPVSIYDHESITKLRGVCS